MSLDLGDQVLLSESREDLNDFDYIIKQVVEDYLKKLEGELVFEKLKDDRKQDSEENNGRSTTTEEAVQEYLEGLEEIVLE